MRDYIYIKVVEGRDLIVMDRSGNSDPLCTVYLNAQPDVKYSTNTVSKSLNPKWSDKTFVFPRPAQAAGPVLATFKVYDKDFFRTELMGVVQMEVGSVGAGTLLDEWAPLTSTAGVKHKYVAPGSTDYGAVRVLVASGSHKIPPEDWDKGPRAQGTAHVISHPSFDAAPAPSSLGTMMLGAVGRAPKGASLHQDSGQLGEILEFIYVKVLRGRNLAPMDQNGLSDPYAVVSINNRKETCRTKIMAGTLNPVWNQDEFFTFKSGPDARTVKVTLYDDDNVGGDDSMGEVLIPMNIKVPGEVHTGWYPVQVPRLASSFPGTNGYKLRHLHDALPTKLGEVEVVISRGFNDQPPKDPNSMAAFRFAIGHIEVEVLQLSMIKKRCDRPYLKLKHEGRTMKSKVGAMDKAKNATFTGAGARWKYPVTELLGPFADIHLQLWDSDTYTSDDQLGEGTPFETWLEVLEPGAHHTLQVQDRPKQPIANMKVSFTFSLDPLVKGAAYGMAPYLMNTPVYIKPDAKGGSIAGLLAELGRVVDVLLSPITSPLAVILFLQKWESKAVNVSYLSGVLFSYLFLFRLVAWFWPLFFGILVLFQGYVLGLLQQKSPVFLWADEKKKFTGKLQEMWAMNKSAASVYQEALEKQKLKLAQEDEQEDQQGGQVEKEDGFVNRMGNYMSSMVAAPSTKSVVKSIPGLSIYYALMASVGVYTELINVNISYVERLGNSMSFKDPQLSLRLLPVWVAFWFSLAVVWALARGALLCFGYINPLTWTHLLFALLLAAVAPVGKTTAEIIATIDGILISLPLPVSPITFGSIDILTQRAIVTLDEKRSEKGIKKAQEAADAEQLRLAKKNAVAEAERQSFANMGVHNKEGNSITSEDKMRDLLTKRFKKPMDVLMNVFSRVPSTRDYEHQCRAMRQIVLNTHSGKWTHLPNMVTSRDPDDWGIFIRSLYSSNDAKKMAAYQKQVKSEYDRLKKTKKIE